MAAFHGCHSLYRASMDAFHSCHSPKEASMAAEDRLEAALANLAARSTPPRILTGCLSPKIASATRPPLPFFLPAITTVAALAVQANSVTHAYRTHDHANSAATPAAHESPVLLRTTTPTSAPPPLAVFRHPKLKTVAPIAPLPLPRFHLNNRHIRLNHPLPLSLRTAHRCYRHVHCRDIPYSNDIILLDDAAVKHQIRPPPHPPPHPKYTLTMFHYSMLRPHHGSLELPTSSLPLDTFYNQPIMKPLTILHSHMDSSTNPPTRFVLMQWVGLAPEASTWEKWDDFCHSHHFEDKVIFLGWDNDSTSSRGSKEDISHKAACMTISELARLLVS